MLTACLNYCTIKRLMWMKKWNTYWEVKIEVLQQTSKSICKLMPFCQHYMVDVIDAFCSETDSPPWLSYITVLVVRSGQSTDIGCYFTKVGALFLEGQHTVAEKGILTLSWQPCVTGLKCDDTWSSFPLQEQNTVQWTFTLTWTHKSYRGLAKWIINTNINNCMYISLVVFVYTQFQEV